MKLITSSPSSSSKCWYDAASETIIVDGKKKIEEEKKNDKESEWCYEDVKAEISVMEIRWNTAIIWYIFSDTKDDNIDDVSISLTGDSNCSPLYHSTKG